MRDNTIHAAVEPLLIEYAAGVLAGDDRRKVETHVAGCDACRRELDEWRQIADAARLESPSPALPPLDWRRIKGEGRMTARSLPETPSWRRFSALTSLTAALAVVMFMAVLIGGRQPSVAPFGYPYIAPEATTEATAAPAAENIVEIVVATVLIERGEVIQPTQIELRERPADDAPRSAVADLEAVIGKVARMDISPDLPILTGQLTDNLADAATPRATQYVDGYNLAAVPPGMRPVLVAADDIENGAVILPHNLTLYLIDEASAPEGTWFDPAELIYTIARHNISCGQIVTLEMRVTNARDVEPGQPFEESEPCAFIIRTYNPGANSIARDYNGALYPQPVGQNADAYVFTRPLDVGSVVTEADVAPAPQYPIAPVPPGALTDAESIVGHITVAPVSAGQLVLASALNAPPTRAVDAAERIDVNVPLDLVDLPADAQDGELFRLLAQRPSPTPNAPDVGIDTVVLLRLQFAGVVVLGVLPGDEQLMRDLVREDVQMRLEPVQPEDTGTRSSPIRHIDSQGDMTYVTLDRSTFVLPVDAQPGSVFSILVTEFQMPTEEPFAVNPLATPSFAEEVVPHDVQLVEYDANTITLSMSDDAFLDLRRYFNVPAGGSIFLQLIPPQP